MAARSWYTRVVDAEGKPLVVPDKKSHESFVYEHRGLARLVAHGVICPSVARCTSGVDAKQPSVDKALATHTKAQAAHLAEYFLHRARYDAAAEEGAAAAAPSPPPPPKKRARDASSLSAEGWKRAAALQDEEIRRLRAELAALRDAA
jgi:hypothetical protein